MNEIIVPGRSPKVQPGQQIEIVRDGPAIYLRTITTIPLEPENAASLASVIAKAGEEARAARAAILQPQNGAAFQ